MTKWLKSCSPEDKKKKPKAVPSSSPVIDLTDGAFSMPSPAKTTKSKKNVIPDDSDDDPGPSKRKAIEIVSSDEDSKPSAPPKKKVATGPKTGTKRKAESEEPASKSKAKGKAKAEDDDDDGFVVPDDEDEDVKPKKPKASTSKATNGTSLKKASPAKMEVDEKPKSKWQPGKVPGVAHNPGSKEIPDGQPNCLAGLTFVFTGELEALGRDEAQDLAKRYGARVTGAPSSKTSYVVVGANAGESKLKKIRSHNLETLDEDGFLQLIATRSGNAAKSDPKFVKKQEEETKKIKQAAKQMGPAKGSSDDKNQLWTVKYAPKTLKEICGNKGQVEKLQKWLDGFETARANNFKKGGPDGSGLYRAVLISGPPGIGKTSAAHLVANLGGYTVLELNASDTRGKKLLEVRASENFEGPLLQEYAQAALRSTIDNRPIDGFFGAEDDTDDTTKKAKSAISGSAKQRMVLIMDEVDGMSAGDRGGVGALNALIKKTKTPIICICNDSKSVKMKPLLATTLNLSFRRPSAAEIKSRMMSIAFKEGLKTDGTVIDQLVAGSQSDIRQIVNMLATWRLGQDTMSFDEGKQYAAMQAKNTIQTPFTLTNQLFAPGTFKDRGNPRILDGKLELYFGDFGLIPLFVQENYLKHKFSLSMQLEGPDKELKRLELVAKASAAISDGDLVDRMVHGDQQQWSLLPVHGMFSSVRPAYFCHGHGGFGGGGGGGYGSNAATNTSAFPAWFGNNSKQGKLQRFLGDIQIRMRLHVSGDRREIRQSYLPTLMPKLLKPLVDEGADAIPELIKLMDEYYLTKEEWDAIMELAIADEDPTKSIPSATKAAFTKKYNAMDHPIVFHSGNVLPSGKLKAARPAADLEDVIEGDDSGPEEEEEDPSEGDDQKTALKDRLIKAKKPKAKAAAKAESKTTKAKAAPKSKK